MLGVVVWWRRRAHPGAMNPRATAHPRPRRRGPRRLRLALRDPRRATSAPSGAEAEKRVFRDVEADDVARVTLRTKDGAGGRASRAARAAGARGAASRSRRTRRTPTASPSTPRRSCAARPSIDEPGPPAEYGLDGPAAGALPRRRARSTCSASASARRSAPTPTWRPRRDRAGLAVASYRTTRLERSLDDLREKRARALRPRRRGRGARALEGRRGAARARRAGPGGLAPGRAARGRGRRAHRLEAALRPRVPARHGLRRRAARPT